LRSAKSTRLETVTDLWRRKIHRVFEFAQAEFQQKALPHRFRHTFCRILLQRGVPVADVAELIGDTEDIVYKHYAKWVPERQARLTEVLKTAFEDRPRLVAIDTRKTHVRVG
jgi:site-specific recombinase XerD